MSDDNTTARGKRAPFGDEPLTDEDEVAFINSFQRLPAGDRHRIISLIRATLVRQINEERNEQ